MPDNYADRRRFIRLNTVLPVEFCIIGPKGELLLDWAQGFTNNIAKGGICLTVNNLKDHAVILLEDKTAKFSLRINLPFNNKVIECVARPAWVKKVKNKPFSQFLTGLEYETIKDKDSQHLVNFARFKKYFTYLVSSFVITLCFIVVVSGVYNFNQYSKNKKLVSDLQSTLSQISNLNLKISSIIKEKSDIEMRIKDERSKNTELVKMIEQLSKEKAASPSEEQVVSSQLASLHKSLEVLKLEKETLEQRLLLLSDEQKKASLRLGELKEEYKPLKKEVLDKMYKWLATHQNVRTGLVSSFEGDSELSDSAFIYDQALVALAFTVKGDFDKASRIFSCFQKAKRINGVFANAYYASNADVMEYTVHAGPNIWLGIAILQYTNKTGDKKYLPLALDIVHWVIDFQEADPDKGIKGGPEVSWYSTEHNLDAYAFFNMFYKITSDNKYLKARDNTFNWLKKFAYSNSSLPVKRGKGDSTIATDTYAWSIASIGPKNLASIEMSPIGIVEFAENNCLVNVDFEAIDKKIIKVQGFDFAKAAHIARGGVISCEWTAQMVLTYNIISQYFKNLGDLDKSSVYKEKAELFLSELDKMIITSLSPTGQGEGCLPYASTSFVDTGHGWMTPKGKQTGSLSSTAYAFFAYLGYNPLTLDGKLDF